jgi:NADH-ubiquinone oxidoreductase chain 4
LYNFSSNHFQFTQDVDEVHFCDFYSGVDGLSIYFALVTAIITPIALLSNWNSIKVTVRAYVIIMLLLETLLLAVFLLLDIFLFYVFFESILPPAEWNGKLLAWDKLSKYGDTLKLLIPSYIRKTISG